MSGLCTASNPSARYSGGGVGVDVVVEAAAVDVAVVELEEVAIMDIAVDPLPPAPGTAILVLCALFIVVTKAFTPRIPMFIRSRITIVNIGHRDFIAIYCLIEIESG